MKLRCVIFRSWEALKHPWKPAEILSDFKSNFQIFASGAEASVREYQEKIAKIELGAQNEAGKAAQAAAKQRLEDEKKANEKRLEEAARVAHALVEIEKQKDAEIEK